MSRGIAWGLRPVAAFIVLLGVLFGFTSPSHAYVQQVIIDATNTANYTPIPVGSSTPGASVSYTIYTGRIVGALDPANPLNSVITDLNLAPQSGGLVNYTTVFSIVTPTNPAARSGLMIHVVPNRGSSSGINTNALVAGATYVQSGWQGDLLSQCSTAPVPSYPCVSLSSPYGSASGSYPFFTPPTNPTGLADFVIQVPVATSDGNVPNGTNTITGQVYGHVCTGTNGCGLAVGSSPTSTAHLQIQGPAFVPYQPASTDTSQAQMWTVSSQTPAGVDSAKTPIPSADWAWAYCPSGWPGTPNPNYVCLRNGTFDPTLLYEVTYTAANPLVLGVGFAGFRDLASFLRYGTTAPGGGSNPIAGTVTTALTMGASQSGAFIHGLVFYGFNEDEDGRIVFDGAWPQIDGRMMVMNVRWGQPNNLMYLYMGGDEAPVWWADYPNLARNLPADGMLHRCSASGTCPQILETFGSAELYSEKMSVALCGFTCAADIPLPSNVYRYYTPGATHGGGTASFTWASPNSISIPSGQSLPNDPIPETNTNNALQADFIQWLTNGTPMPPSVYPTLASGQLVPTTQVATQFPNVPGLAYEGMQAWPPFVYNFGPGENYDQESGVPTIQPPSIQQVLPVYAATVNADGNENVSGLPTVLGQAPLGTYVGWNLATTGWYGPNASNGPGSVGQVFAGAGNSGGFWPFWDTKANRLAAGDPRLSLEERYGTSAGYVCVALQAADAAIGQRFLLGSDAETLRTSVQASNVLGAPFTPTSADMALANSLCGLSAGAPVVAQIAPNSGPSGIPVTVTGMNFIGTQSVIFGVTPSNSFTINSDTSLTAIAPPGGTGTVDVTVTNIAGTSATSANDQFTFGAEPAPTVTAVSPSGGPTAGGTSVTITGTNLYGATAVHFGVGSASFTVSSPTQITATSPNGSGTVDVTVTTPTSTSATSPADQFTYVAAPPTVTGVSPSVGSEGGGTIVTITGTGLATATAVNFGGVPSSDVVAVSNTTVMAISPAGSGRVDVVVTTEGGTSAISAADRFSYESDGSQSWVSAASGSDSNPCTRSAPCLTFAGAFAKTVPGGEIDVLDPGDYGPLTITNAITIYNGGSGVAGIFVSGTSAITIQAGSSDVVNLRGLTLNGGGGGNNSGVLVTSGGTINVQKCLIQSFKGTAAGVAGINISPTAGSVDVRVEDSTIVTNNPGVYIRPGSGAVANVLIRHSHVDNNSGGGVRSDGTGGGTVITGISDSTASENLDNGVIAIAGPGSATVNLARDLINANGLAGVVSNQSDGGTATVNIGSSQILGNAFGVQSVGGGSIVSYENNQLAGNGSDGSFTANAAMQ